MKKMIIYILMLIFILCGCVRIVGPEEIETDVNTTEIYITTVAQESTKEQETTYETESVSETHPVLYEGYTITKEEFDKAEGSMTWDLEYPQLAGEGREYDRVNELIKQTAVEFNTPDWEIKDKTRERGFTGKYKIIWQTEEIVSIEFTSIYTAKGAANPSYDCCGMTIDLAAGMVVALDNYIESIEIVLKQIEAGNYTVEYGAFYLMSNGEIMNEIAEEFSNLDLNVYKDNFCVDEDELYLIVDNIIGSDYAIIKIPLNALK